MTQGTPPPVRAIPVGPGSYAQLADAYAVRYGRPGVVTAIGVISIVVASISLIANLGMGFQAVVVYSTSRMVAAVTAPPTQTPQDDAATVIVEDEFLSANGLPLQQRKQVADALGSFQPMSEPRRQQLDALLVDSGRRVIPPTTPQATVPSLRKLVKNSGRLPKLGGKEGRVFFELTTGRLEVDDDNAVFFPADGSPAIRTTGPVAGSEGSMVLSPAQVQAALEQVQSLSGGSMTQPQRDALANALRQTWQPLVQPSPSVAGIRGQFKSATRQGDGTIVLVTTNGTCEILPQGVVQMSEMVLATATGGPVSVMSSMSMNVALAAAFVSTALAVALLILGIVALRQSRTVAWWLKLWAGVKLLSLVGGAVAWVWFYRDMFGAFASGAGNEEARRIATVVVIGVSVLAGLWPVVLLILLHTRRLREYYAAPG